ncbi:hypothetical protein acsn021_11230 [Anaerocolumna cellulosilytica]|uniref:Uncharacterized protein n=1 Tax=Anaerocolumna cellulosilytica TaxID=433286 RepID=A0A6S6QSG1_9FIRM|nr:immunoglobulin-like domain-containing protein [Anaerocolumna cellulosilytica]MBB5194610.1 hypothetical protein [Anaerocolumna cellulosilytica]BCJ93554.1 hypothetical protein acsn021_11230 [Anaerocolumna cellulosilytica]
MMKKKHKILIMSGILSLSVAAICGFNYYSLELNQDRYTLELGEQLKTEVADYASGNINNAKLNLSEVDVNKVGTYQANVKGKIQNLSFSVDVVDTTAPSAEVIENKTFYTFEQVKASMLLEDVKDESKVIVTFEDGKEVHTYEKGGFIEEKVILTDEYSNVTVLSVTFEIVADSTKPVIKGAKNSKVYIGETVDFLKGVSAMDDRDGDVTNSIVVDASKVDTGKAGKYKLKYSVKDNAGNQATKTVTITVLEDKAPVFKGLTALTVNVGSKVDYLSNVSATDDRDGDVTTSIKVDSTKVNLTKAGTYKVTYSVTDSTGNKTIESRTVNVKSKAVKSETTQSQTSDNSGNTNKKITSNGKKNSSSGSKNSNSSGFDFFEVKPSGEQPNGDVPAGGKQGVGTWD